MAIRFLLLNVATVIFLPLVGQRTRGRGETMKNNMNKNKQAIWVLWIIMGLNFLVAIFKIVIGTIANSGSIIADGYHSLSDGSGNIVGIVGLSIAGRPVDDNHPYGHKKFETISSLKSLICFDSLILLLKYSVSLHIYIHPLLV